MFNHNERKTYCNSYFIQILTQDFHVGKNIHTDYFITILHKALETTEIL